MTENKVSLIEIPKFDKYKYLNGPQRFIQSLSVIFLRTIEKFYPLVSPYGDPTFYDPTMLEWTAEFESNWKLIRQELEQVLQYKDDLPCFQDISEDDSYLTQDRNWKTFWIYNFGGIPVENNVKRCPTTARLLSQVPGLTSALFSILEPHKHIEPHRGPFKGITRCLLALMIPEPKEKVRIRVGNDIRHWEEGKFLVFDDTYNHEVWNDTDGVRVVLFMDVDRPLYFPFNLINKLILKSFSISPKVRRMVENQVKWDLDKFKT
jgi:ornithine lipid ester-linked acyl 2-hydroxylase